jgi:hypothetical protein
MPQLSLRVEVIDNSNKSQPGLPTCFTVLGFTCGSVAYITRDSGKSTIWQLHFGASGEPVSRVRRVFSDPYEILAYLREGSRLASEETPGVPTPTAAGAVEPSPGRSPRPRLPGST